MARNRSNSCLGALIVGAALTASPVTAAENHAGVAAISKYCDTCWRNAGLDAHSWNDYTQEVFVRLLERLPPESWSRVFQPDTAERTEFLRAIDTVKKRGQRARRFRSLEGDVVDHRRDQPEAFGQVRRLAEQHLSPEQTRILRLSLEGWTASQIGALLHKPPARVSDAKYKAIRKLQAAAAAQSV